MERIVLVRHGESEYSARGLLNGDASVAVGLTASGAEQARELGEILAGEPLDLCVTSDLLRTQLTAELALAGRTVTREAWGELADPRAGAYEGLRLDDYRAWAWTAGSGEDAPGGGESRLATVERYVRGYRSLLDRPERSILVVLHALPIAYVLRALEGDPPAARMDRLVEYAHPYRLSRAQLAEALEVLERWAREPSW